ncbi:hypothetical protein E2C01_036976 [Portunus trituberculatus]|uniref:C2H2-type domain-containing protein n=1 Tax=Portunus trituberculatus TaxID=210409 RepID=A0A5B7FA64_PORTR|nr:hypothetical protein [Portunus trituberculatus]
MNTIASEQGDEVRPTFHKLRISKYGNTLVTYARELDPKGTGPFPDLTTVHRECLTMQSILFQTPEFAHVLDEPHSDFTDSNASAFEFDSNFDKDCIVVTARVNLFKQMGTGKPDKGEFVCPKCGSFRTSCVSTFRSHLCREASYDRYQCVECGLNNSLLPSLQRHYTKMHHAPFTSECYLELPVEEEKEGWVEQVINHQKNLIKKWQEKGDTDPSFESPSQTGQYQMPQGKSAVSSRRSSNASSHSLSSETTQEQGGIVLHDSGSERGRFICDTCGSECRSAAGLKSHTTAMHQARFKCHYCPFASNSEDAVKQHSIAKHPKLQSEVLDVSQRIKVQRGDSVSDENKTQEKSRENQKQESIASPAVESSLTTTLESSALNLQCFEDVNEETCEGEVALEIDPLEDSQSSVAMDHWIQNHPLLDFKFDLVLRHSGEVSNQVVTSTTLDKDLSQEATDSEKNVCTSDIDAEEDAGVTSSIASCSDITSSSESSKVVPSRQREGLKDTSTRRSLDTEEEEIMEVSELIAKESEGQPDAGETEDMIYKCGLCKKSSDKLQELKAHVNKVSYVSN